MSNSNISGVSFSLRTRKAVKMTEDDDMLDEDAMLTNEDKAKKVALQGSDCRTRKKACANCTCGRFELLLCYFTLF